MKYGDGGLINQTPVPMSHSSLSVVSVFDFAVIMVKLVRNRNAKQSPSPQFLKANPQMSHIPMKYTVFPTMMPPYIK